MSTLKLLRPFEFQQASLGANRKRKLFRWGRRAGKSRTCLSAAVVGHGPKDAAGNPAFHGLAQGRDVLWLGPDYGQLETIWREEVKPRFDAADGCRTNENNMTGWVGSNRLIIRTTENPRALRGMGKNAGGIIIDEAAWLDLENLMKDVVIPILLDNEGWLIVASTPNSSHDGHTNDEGAKRTPSYFNILCEEERLGNLPNWFQSHHDARDNPRISTAGFNELVAEYEEGSAKLQQEVFAMLLRGGAGFAFPELSEQRHVKLKSPHEVTEVIGGMDWGWSKHGYLGLLGLHQRGVHLMHEIPFNGPIAPEKRKDPERVGFKAGQTWMLALRDKKIPELPQLVYCDSAMDAVTQGGLSVMQLVQVGLQRSMDDLAPACVPSTKGPGSRVMRKNALHALLRYKVVEAENGMEVVVEEPRFTVDVTCPFWWRTTKALMLDPKKPEDVDTTGPDHAYDGSTYAIAMAFPELMIKSSGKSRDPRGKTDRLSVRADREFDELMAPKRKAPSYRVYG